MTFQPGDIALLSYASANRDDEVFPDPFRLDVQRENAASHLAFGFGRHFCLGAHLARMEVRALFKELLARLDHVELAGEPTFVQSRLVSGPKTLPITYGLRSQRSTSPAVGHGGGGGGRRGGGGDISLVATPQATVAEAGRGPVSGSLGGTMAGAD